MKLMRLAFVGVLVAATLGMGCGLVTPVADGAKAAVVTPPGQPLPAPPASDNTTLYTIGGILAAAAMSVIGVVTHGVVTQSTIQQLGSALGGSQPAPVATTTTTTTAPVSAAPTAVPAVKTS